MSDKPKLQNLNELLPGDFCLLCGGKPAVIGVFVPEKPEKWGARAGKLRMLRYCLCKKCNEKKDKAELVEKIIRAELIGGAGYE